MKHQKRVPVLYSVIAWPGPGAEHGMPDVWLVLATYKAQAERKLKEHYQQQDWPPLRSVRARRVLASDFQRIL